MTGHDWFDRFVAAGPGYDGVRMSRAELQALLLKAGIGAGLPLGHAEDFSGLADLLASDPQLFAMAIAALDGPHHPAHVEGTEEHVVITQARVLMAGPVVIDALRAGAARVVLHRIDWPLLLWPMLYRAQQVYEVRFGLVSGAKGSVTVEMAKRQALDAFGEAQPVPVQIMEMLKQLAARTYVPASAASRSAGAGAGLSDND